MEITGILKELNYKIGKIIKDPASSSEESKETLKVIDNWRASHAYPLQVIYGHFNLHSRNIVTRLPVKPKV